MIITTVLCSVLHQLSLYNRLMNANSPCVPAQYQPPADNGLELLYQDDALLVLNKPSGLLSVPGRGDSKQDCMASRVQEEFPNALIVHRLDMATSGVLLMAKNADIHRYLSGLFQEREVEKRYVAIVDGQVRQAIGKIELPLITDWPNRPRQIVDHKNGKPSITRFKVLWRNIEKNTTRIELAPETGRSHQLRVHMQSFGHAILGDRLYASDEVLQRSERLMLHAQSLSLIHPLTKEPMRFISEAPF